MEMDMAFGGSPTPFPPDPQFVYQNGLTNLSFLFLLGSLIFYWVGLIISTKSNDPTLTDTEVGSRRQPITTLGWRNILQRVGNLGMISSNLILFFLLGSRWMESGHFPSSNLYESLMFLSWCFTTLHLFLSLRYANFSLGSLFLPSEANDTLFLGAITTPSALFTNAFATITLPKEMQEASPLVPALQSNWLMMHVTVMILSYAALILGSLLSICFLIVTSIPSQTDGPLQGHSSLATKEKLPTTSSTSETSPLFSLSSFFSNEERKGSFFSFNKSTSFSSVYSLAFYLDNLSYRILGIGFPFLTIGILSGAVWANEAWGSYWSWDPKETWALLTWLIFAIYLHTRLNKTMEEEKGTDLGPAARRPGAPQGRAYIGGGRSATAPAPPIGGGGAGGDATVPGVAERLNKKPAIVASFGFIVVWICYLGVNLIGEGLHSYGWIDVS